MRKKIKYKYRRGQNPNSQKNLKLGQAIVHKSNRTVISGAVSDNLVTLPVNIEFALSRAWPQLSRRERQILYLYLIKGLTRSELCETLTVAVGTLNFYSQRIREKLGARTAPQSYAIAAVRYYQELQVITQVLKSMAIYPYPARLTGR